MLTLRCRQLDSAVMIGWAVAEDVLGFDGSPTTIYERSPESTVDDVRDVLPATVNPSNPEEVTVSRPSDALAAQAATDETLTTLLLALGGVALLVGGIGVADTMVIAVLERRSEMFIIGRECTTCHNWSTFHVDRATDKCVWLKGLEDGHVIEDNDNGDALQYVGPSPYRPIALDDHSCSHCPCL